MKKSFPSFAPNLQNIDLEYLSPYSWHTLLLVRDSGSLYVTNKWSLMIEQSVGQQSLQIKNFVHVLYYYFLRWIKY